MTDNAARTKTNMRVYSLKIYSQDGGGRDGEGLHKDAIVLAYQWNLLGEVPERGPHRFDGHDNNILVPYSNDLTLEADDAGTFTLVRRYKSEYARHLKDVLAQGLRAEPPKKENNPQPDDFYTIDATDEKGFEFTFSGCLE